MLTFVASPPRLCWVNPDIIGNMLAVGKDSL